jgi:hypothetical protein
VSCKNAPSTEKKRCSHPLTLPPDISPAPFVGRSCYLGAQACLVIAVGIGKPEAAQSQTGSPTKLSVVVRLSKYPWLSQLKSLADAD